eukprot:scaffold5546_cov247-Pinguiococcus_pyrenoidosus.AAC.4
MPHAQERPDQLIHLGVEERAAVGPRMRLRPLLPFPPSSLHPRQSGLVLLVLALWTSVAACGVQKPAGACSAMTSMIPGTSREEYTQDG